MEEFRKIKGYDYYEVSNYGRVKSLKRKYVPCDKILKPSIDSVGYELVGICVNGKQKSIRIHQLVAMAFLNHEPNGYKSVVDHIDNDKLNNNAENLQLLTSRENVSKSSIKRTSKYTGVSWNKQRGKWCVRIWMNGENVYLGGFDCELKASQVYQKELKEVYKQKIKEL